MKNEIKDKIVVYNKDNFIYPLINDVDVCNAFRCMIKNRLGNHFLKVINSFLLFLGLNHLVYGPWYCDLKNKRCRIVFFDEAGLNKHLIKIINKYKDYAVVYCWNPSSKISYFNCFDKIRCKIYSFDKYDCKKYSFIYHPNIVPKLDYSMNQAIEYDLFFLGVNKGRKKILDKIKNLCPQLNCYFEVIDDEAISYTNPVDYLTYLSMTSKSIGIVELLQNEQYGVTMRTIESIMLRKKLITNNKNIIHEPYYHPDNVYVLPDDNSIDTQSIMRIMKVPFVVTKEMDLSCYYPKQWLNSLFES